MHFKDGFWRFTGQDQVGPTGVASGKGFPAYPDLNTAEHHMTRQSMRVYLSKFLWSYKVTRILS